MENLNDVDNLKKNSNLIKIIIAVILFILICVVVIIGILSKSDSINKIENSDYVPLNITYKVSAENYYNIADKKVKNFLISRDLKTESEVETKEIEEEISTEEVTTEEISTEEITTEEVIMEETIMNDEYIIPHSNLRYLTDDDLKNLGKDELYFARNEIYARHGRKFETQKLRDYFSNKSWYEPLYSKDEFNNSVFNIYEIENIKIIESYELKF